MTNKMNDKEKEQKKVILLFIVGCIIAVAFMAYGIWGAVHNASVQKNKEKKKPKVKNEIVVQPEMQDEKMKESNKNKAPKNEYQKNNTDNTKKEESVFDKVTEGSAPESEENLGAENYDPSSLAIQGVGSDVTEFIGTGYSKLQEELYSYLLRGGLNVTTASLMEGTNLDETTRTATLNFQLDDSLMSKVQVIYTIATGTYEFVMW